MSKRNILFFTFALLFLISCTSKKDENISKSLDLESSTETTKQNFDKYYSAALNGNIETIKTSITEELNIINKHNAEGQSLLMLASFNGHTQLCEYLIKNGAHIEGRDNSGRTPLMYASTGPFSSTVELLLKSGANSNSVDHVEKWTALMNAAAEGQLEVVKILMQYGANKSLKDIDGDTAESFALQKKHFKVLSFLKSYK